MKDFLRSFKYAFSGFLFFLKNEKKGRIHLSIGFAAVLLGLSLSIKVYEWLAILLCIGLVVSFEIFNTSIEMLSDTSHPEISEGIKATKDLAAAGVLFAAIISVIVGLIIFIPYLF